MTDQPSPDRRKHLRRYLWPAWWVLMFVATHLPKIPSPPLDIWNFDKVIHGMMYFVLTFLGGRALISAGRVKGLGTLLAWAGIYLIYAVVDEWLQQFVNRTPSVQDWLANAVGIMAATLILSNFRIKD